MNKLPTDLLKHIYTFSNTKDLTKYLLVNKYQYFITFDTLNKRWPVDVMRIKLIFNLWYKKIKPFHSPPRFYANSWCRKIHPPTERFIFS